MEIRPEMDRVFFTAGAVFALIGVAAGAFGAHALEGRLTPERLATYDVAVRYQLYHAFALLAVAWASTHWPSGLIRTAGWLFIAGILIFSGTVYLLALGGPRWLGAITPLGGLSLIVSWGLLAIGVYTHTQR
jgi:uncharacterized membrane protein YgdD (TMEM256/DUF423 family)